MIGNERVIESDWPTGYDEAWVMIPYGLRNTVRHYSSTGNAHFNSKSKTIDLLVEDVTPSVGLY